MIVCADARALPFKAKKMPHGKAAEAQFNRLWKGNGKQWRHGDAIRRHRVIPLLRYELRRRELQVRGPVAAQPTYGYAEIAR